MNFKVEAQYPIYIFQNNDVNISWNTIKVGLDLKRLSPQEVGNFALQYLESHPTLVNEYISELIFGVKDYELEAYVQKVYHSLHLRLPQQEDSTWNQEWIKWRFCIMTEMRKDISDDEKLLQAIEGVYADFGYPIDMVPFIYYMPAQEPELIDQLGPEKARKRLIMKLDQFLLQERKKIEAGYNTLPQKIY